MIQKGKASIDLPEDTPSHLEAATPHPLPCPTSKGPFFLSFFLLGSWSAVSASDGTSRSYPFFTSVGTGETNVRFCQFQDGRQSTAWGSFGVKQWRRGVFLPLPESSKARVCIAVTSTAIFHPHAVERPLVDAESHVWTTVQGSRRRPSQLAMVGRTDTSGLSLTGFHPPQASSSAEGRIGTGLRFPLETK